MLVSVIVRSMGRPYLRDALESLCEQDYPSLEVLVVDATGGSHPPLPDLPWKTGHEIRLVTGNGPLLRPHAANVGLLAARGEWLCFLDDDDSYDADFVSSMVREAGHHPGHLLIYGSSKTIDANGEVSHLFGVPFNRALMFCGPLFYWQAALINRRVIELGCRFDESLPVCEDRDFLAQIAEHGDFAYVPVTATNYRLTLGTSGTAQGPNRHPEKHIPFESKLRAKWAGSGLHHMQRASNGSRKAIAAYFSGDVDGACAAFDAVLAEYPDDPNALHGLGRIAFEREQLDVAEQRVRRAVEIAPAVAEYRWTLANILRARGLLPEAREQALVAANDANFHEAAHALLRELPVPQQAFAQAAAAGPITLAVTTNAGAPVGRLSMCPCGSGLRYKACHGRSGAMHAVSPPPPAFDHLVVEAQRLFEAGAATRAVAALASLSPDAVDNALRCAIAGNILLEHGDLDGAQRWFTRALVIDPDCAAGALMNACADMQNAKTLRASIYREIAALREKLGSGVHAAMPDDTVHIVATMADVGGSERHAANLFRVLSSAMPTRLWSTAPAAETWSRDLPIRVINPDAGDFPRTGTLVMIGQYFDIAGWFSQAAFHRVVIRNNIDLPQLLLEKVSDFEFYGKHFQLDFSYPSDQFRQRVGLPGHVERSLTNQTLFTPRNPAPPASPHGLVVGRHSRDDRMKHHPNDAEFSRNIVRAGHRVRLMGASVVADALARGGDAEGIEVVPFASQSAPDFLAGLDCFLYRAHPHWYETGGNVVAEAMAMQIPVIVFAGQIGFAEAIEHGVNGFLVSTEAEALDVINQLAADPELRARIGLRARQMLEQLSNEQSVRTINFYRGREFSTPDEVGATLSR